MSDVRAFAELLRSAGPAVVFTGAGMSTESGLPDFRSAGGLWRNNRRFEDLASRDALAERFQDFVAFYRWRIELLGRHQPHAGHRVLAAWQRRGVVDALITQNVDGYHTDAGATGVLELHGTLRTVRCASCGESAPAQAFLADGAELCPCGGRRRPDVVLFGEPLPQPTLDQAIAASRRTRLFVVLGSSLLVSPANLLPELAVEAGAALVIVNREPTPLDDWAALASRRSIGELLRETEALLAPA